MSPSIRARLLRRPEIRAIPSPRLTVPLACFLGVFAAYAVGVFTIAGGAVFLAGDAAAVGVVAAAALAYRRGGLAVAWVTVYASLLGYSADHYLLGLSGRSLGERLVAFLGVDGLVFVGIEALVLGTLAWVAGTVAARIVGSVREA
ncbi:hypothetical protein [Halorubrum sp. F4]|uniref:hypothetical protein n=1 Tax=Halorubrum sp. F4 TaxID=2989715 RepID=UPI002481069C|nr:hypothetical protein [Halorubrum sp. F4]